MKRSKTSRTGTKQLQIAGSSVEAVERTQLVKEIQRTFCEATGTKDVTLAEQLIGQAGASQVWSTFKNDGERIAGAMAALGEIKPENATEALLAVQMIGVHHSALMYLRRASVEGQTFEEANANILRATRLMRLFTDQLEAMAKLKGKAGQQRVTVEHVHVHNGGQAIVGAVNTDLTRRGANE